MNSTLSLYQVLLPRLNLLEAETLILRRMLQFTTAQPTKNIGLQIERCGKALDTIHHTFETYGLDNPNDTTSIPSPKPPPPA